MLRERGQQAQREHVRICRKREFQWKLGRHSVRMYIWVGMENFSTNLVDIIYFEETEFVTSYVRLTPSHHASMRAQHLSHEFSDGPSFTIYGNRHSPSSLPMSECTSVIPSQQTSFLDIPSQHASKNHASETYFFPKRYGTEKYGIVPMWDGGLAVEDGHKSRKCFTFSIVCDSILP